MVKYLVANEVPRVRFPDGAYLARVAQLVAPRAYVPMVQGSSPCTSIFWTYPTTAWCTDLPISNIERSYHGETTGSHPNSEVKHHWACSVLRWGTTRESQVVYVLHGNVPVAQWLRRVTTNHEIGGSSPSRNAFVCHCDQTPWPSG